MACTAALGDQPPITKTQQSMLSMYTMAAATKAETGHVNRCAGTPHQQHMRIAWHRCARVHLLLAQKHGGL